MSNRSHMTRPCENCPYRKDAPLKHWHRTEYESVMAGEQSQMGTTFACHKQRDLPQERRGLCAGFLADQKERNVPSIALRLVLMQDEGARQAYENVDTSGLEMYPDAETMCRANGVRRRRR